VEYPTSLSSFISFLKANSLIFATVFDKNLLYLEKNIRLLRLYVNDILTAKCGMRIVFS